MTDDLHVIERPTLSMARFRGLYLVVHPTIPPSDSDWDHLIAFLRADLDDLPRNHRIKTLVYAAGGGPNAAQRRRVVQLLDGRSNITGVLTASSAVRAIVTAFGWFRNEIRAFPPHDFAGAISYLGLNSRMAPEVTEHLNRMLARWQSRVSLPDQDPNHPVV
jgi:hypothetical protein